MAPGAGVMVPFMMNAPEVPSVTRDQVPHWVATSPTVAQHCVPGSDPSATPSVHANASPFGSMSRAPMLTM